MELIGVVNNVKDLLYFWIEFDFPSISYLKPIIIIFFITY